jgi:hypothetical protein
LLKWYLNSSKCVLSSTCQTRILTSNSKLINNVAKSLTQQRLKIEQEAKESQNLSGRIIHSYWYLNFRRGMSSAKKDPGRSTPCWKVLASNWCLPRFTKPLLVLLSLEVNIRHLWMML